MKRIDNNIDKVVVTIILVDIIIIIAEVAMDIIIITELHNIKVLAIMSKQKLIIIITILDIKERVNMVLLNKLIRDMVIIINRIIIMS
jgi:hypothetical protein